MRLLVSVRSAAEVAPALAGGADVIDAKEPSLGSLGAVTLPTLRTIVAAVPVERALSVALGDPPGPVAAAQVTGAVSGVLTGRGESYVKLGLAGATGSDPVALVASAAAAAEGPRLVLVAYADWTQARTPSLSDVSRLAARGGAAGVLVDTWSKDDGDLFRYLDVAALRAWAAEARALGLLVAVAGSLSADAIARLTGVPVDIVGVRGAACTGGRTGTVTEVLVGQLKRAAERATVSLAPV